MSSGADEEQLLRSVALQNANTILLTRQRAEQELVRAKEALESRTRELAHSLAMMRATLEAATDGIVVTDGLGKVTGFNQRYVEMWRLPPGATDARDHRTLLEISGGQFDDPVPFMARIEQIYASSPPESFDKLELADGRVFERFSRIQFVDGANVGRVWSFRDVTERERLYDDAKRAADEREVLLEAERAARAEAERISLMKDEFLATLSHELRTPLNAILGWSQILRSSGRTPDAELDEGLAVIERNAKVQTQLIEDLLDMSRIISGKVRLDVQRVDLQDVVKAAVASVRHSAEVREIRLQLVLDPVAGPVRGDPNRLQQVFWNLLANAIKFTPKGGRVQVVLQRVNSHVEVCVADSGQGVRPDFLPHVFERFRQADGSTTRNHGGLGLGLSIVKSLVELHGGTVRASSPGEGQGATFCVTLPAIVVNLVDEDVPREHPRGRAPGLSASDHPSLAGVSVLVVDDEPDARTLLRRVLEDCGAQVFVAESAREGLALLRRERPDMLISDIGMPVEDGYDFIRQVRQLSPQEGGRTPAAALTAFARAEDRTRALRAGFQTHVAKPVEPTELTAVVASLATRRETTDRTPPTV